MKFISIKDLYPDLYEYIPGWIKGTYYCITGSTGSGKSKFARYSFAEWTYKYCKANNIPFVVIYFALEESEDFFWTTLLLDRLHERFGIHLTYYQYKGFHPGMTDEILAQVKEILPDIEDMKKYIQVIDNVSNPTGLLREIEERLRPFGEMIMGEPIQDEEGNVIISKRFKYHDPNFQPVIVADHIGLLSPENNKFSAVNTLHLAITKWSDYVIKLICKRYSAIVASVHQQGIS